MTSPWPQILPICYNRQHRQVETSRVSLNWTRTVFQSLASNYWDIFSPMSDSNLLSRIEVVRARLVPLRDGL